MPNIVAVASTKSDSVSSGIPFSSSASGLHTTTRWPQPPGLSGSSIPAQSVYSAPAAINRAGSAPARRRDRGPPRRGGRPERRSDRQRTRTRLGSRSNAPARGMQNREIRHRPPPRRRLQSEEGARQEAKNDRELEERGHPSEQQSEGKSCRRDIARGIVYASKLENHRHPEYGGEDEACDEDSGAGPDRGSGCHDVLPVTLCSSLHPFTVPSGTRGPC